MLLKDYDTVNFFCVPCSKSIYSAAPNETPFVVLVQAYYWQGNTVYANKFACPCGIGKITDTAALCPKSPANTYQPLEGGTAAISCPDNTISEAGSSSWDDCQCTTNFAKEYTFSSIGEKISFNCYCDPGYYVLGNQCIKCELCDSLTHPGHYKNGCGKANAGVCRKCEACADASQKRVGCGFFSAGECRDKDELVRTPFCPVPDEDQSVLAISVRQASGLGAFSFEQVFGTDAEGAHFVCSEPCDGVKYDSIQCDGPFACNVKTCAEKTEANELPRACPVVIEGDDLLPAGKSMRDRKRRETCVPCNDCGHANDLFLEGASKTNYYEHWGSGCARECSKLMCSENMIWDWTARRCQRCEELRDVRLCSKRDRLMLSLETRSVTGNWPLLHFPECEGEFASKKLETFKYGICAVCDAVSEKAALCPDENEYPAACENERVACRACHRAGRVGSARLVDVFKGWWYNARTRAFEPLHCQIAACVDEAYTGVGVADRLCMTPCSAVVCAANEVAVPCRLPHDARCEPVFPALAARQSYADGEVNLLNEVDDMKHRRFASFENTLIALGDAAYEYQCVWNADGIFDSRASPAGLTNVIWRPGRSDDDEFAKRGTQVCRAWDVERGVELPLLPLQNTISASSEREQTENSSRRMLVNTEAYVMSYRFDGAFAAAETTDVNCAFTDTEHVAGPHMLHGAHVGGAGRLFLMLRLYEARATVAVTVPSDRRLHEALWLQSLLVSFAVVDMTQYGEGISAGVTVSAAVTADEKNISDVGDNFVLESFWVQNKSEALYVAPVQPTYLNLLYVPDQCKSHSGWFLHPSLRQYITGLHDEDFITCNEYSWGGPRQGKCVQDTAYTSVCYWCCAACVRDCCRDPVQSAYSHMREICQSAWPVYPQYVPPSIPGTEAIGETNSMFKLDIIDEYLSRWSRCNTTDMLALLVLKMQIAPFVSQPELTNYSWLQQHHGSAVPFNASVGCFRGVKVLAGTECHGVQNAAAVYVRQQPYTYEPAPSGCADCGGSCSECTADRTLLGLRHVLAHTRGVRAAQHAGSAGLVRYQLQKLPQPLHLVQAHAWQPFGACAVLATATNETHESVVCVGDDITELRSSRKGSADRFIGAFGCEVGGVQKKIFMLSGKSLRLTKLTYTNDATQTDRLVLDEGGLSNAWISVAAERELVVALGINNDNQLEVGLYGIIVKDSRWHLQLVRAPVALDVAYEVVKNQPTDPWLTYGRVAACNVAACTQVYLAAAVKGEQVAAEGAARQGSALVLYACVGRAASTAAVQCASATLEKTADILPSFVSVAFLRADGEHEHWVVGVRGFVFAVTSAADSTVMELQLQSELREQQFLKVDPLFYTFGVSGGVASSTEVLAYLDGFVRVHGNVSVDTAYAVVVVPPSREADDPAEQVNSSVAERPLPVLRLKLARASYHVEAVNGPGLPVFERTGELAAADEFTQLSVSQHVVTPFAQRRAGFLASYEDTGLNHRIALPSAYGRYEVLEDECVFVDRQTGSNTSTEISGLRLRLTASAAQSTRPWLLLQFEVPCLAELAVTCSTTLPVQVLCPPDDVMILVMHAALSKATVYSLAAGGQDLTVQAKTPAACVFLGAGAAWVNSVAFESEPTQAEVLRRLRRSAELRQPPPPAPVASSWRRERRVLTLNPVENMRVDITLARDPFFAKPVSVGVDDVQLAPVLSVVPPRRGQGAMCASVRVPTAAELGEIGLASLAVLDHWPRVHVTLSLETAGACAFEARLHTSATACPARPAAPSGLQRLGCRLRTDARSVRTAYAECQLEAPLGRELGVAVWPQAGCELGAGDSLVAWLRPYTALSSCPSGQFLDAEGECANCHETEAQLLACALGRRLSGCPAIDQQSVCVPCEDGASNVASGRARWVASNESVCAWECGQDFFRVSEQCFNCSVQETACPPGQRWQACDAGAQQDAGCVACPDLRLQKGSYAANEEYVEAEECQTRCRAGFYNDTATLAAGHCKRCWDRAELVLHAGLEQQFFAFDNCTATRNARWRPCTPEPGARVVGSDPGAGTDADPFTGRCVLACEAGWRRLNATEAVETNVTCQACAPPRKVEFGNVTLLALEPHAFEWQAESCAITCRAPWQSTRARGGAEDTCVLCEAEDGSFLCPDGRYPAGPYCACETCENL